MKSPLHSHTSLLMDPRHSSHTDTRMGSERHGCCSTTHGNTSAGSFSTWHYTSSQDGFFLPGLSAYTLSYNYNILHPRVPFSLSAHPGRVSILGCDHCIILGTAHTGGSSAEVSTKVQTHTWTSSWGSSHTAIFASLCGLKRKPLCLSPLQLEPLSPLSLAYCLSALLRFLPRQPILHRTSRRFSTAALLLPR